MRASAPASAGVVLLHLLAAALPVLASGMPQADPRTQLERLRHEQKSAAPPSDAEVSRRLAEIGRDLIARGGEAESIEILSEAISRDPTNGPALANLTLAYAKHGDLVFAEFYLDLALQSAVSGDVDPGIYEYLGNVYEAQNQINDAVTAWEQARRLGKDTPVIRARIDKARAEWAYGHRQKYLGGERFEIFYDPAIPTEAVEQLESSLENAAISEAEFFMAPPPLGQIVILYEGRRYFRYEETPDWVAGYYDGKIRVPVEAGQETSEAVLGILRHELAHAFLRGISTGRAPSWLQEGLAQFVEGRRMDRSVVAPLLKTSPFPFLEASETLFRQRTDREQARRAYILSLSFTQFLADRSGPGNAVCLGSDLAHGKSLRDAFMELFGESPEALEKSWRGENQ